MTAVDMCALHPAELLTITGSKGWMDLCTTQVALGFTKQCAAFFEKCATVLTVGVAVVIAALFLAAQLVIMRHKRKEELARATGGYHFPVEINFPPEEP